MMNIFDTIDELGKRLSRIEGTLERHSQDIKDITKIVSKNDATTYDKTTRLQMRATNAEKTLSDMSSRIISLENSKDNIVKRLDRVDDQATDNHHAIGQVQADIKELQT